MTCQHGFISEMIIFSLGPEIINSLATLRLQLLLLPDLVAGGLEDRVCRQDRQRVQVVETNIAAADRNNMFVVAPVDCV